MYLLLKTQEKTYKNTHLSFGGQYFLWASCYGCTLAQTPFFNIKGDSMNLTLIYIYVVESYLSQGPSCSVFEYFALNQPKSKGFNCSFDVKHVSVAQFSQKFQAKMSKTDITLVSNSSNHPLVENQKYLGRKSSKSKQALPIYETVKSKYLPTQKYIPRLISLTSTTQSRTKRTINRLTRNKTEKSGLILFIIGIRTSLTI